jgi:hypothetical protein
VAESKRPILSLTGLIKPEEDAPFDLAAYDVLLPCRRFDVDHKVALLGRVSLTAEFLLRLLKSVDGIDEGDAAKFFGFDLRDMSFVLSEVETLGYVERREGRLWLTFAGMSLFQPGSDQPQIFEVEARRENVGFDLISLAPEPPRGLDEFDRRLPELALLQPELASRAAARLPSAFRRFYPEINARRDRAAGDRRDLYSIDAVAPSDRFSSLVRIVVRSSGLRPWVGQPDVSEWRTETEQEDRSEVLDAASAFVDGLTVDKRSDDVEAYAALLTLAPEFLKEFVRRDGLAVERYFREAFTRVGEVRSDRQTIPLVGSILGRENLRKVTEVLTYGLQSKTRPSAILWLTPMAKSWGATRMLPEFLRQLRTQLRTVREDGTTVHAHAIGLITGWPEAYLEKAFDQLASSEIPQFPRSLEILLVPRVMVAVAIHVPIGANNGLPVPLGLISFDPRVVGRAEDYMASKSRPYLKSGSMEALVLAELHGGRDRQSLTEAITSNDGI